MNTVLMLVLLSAAPERLTVEDAVRLALQNNQLVQASREQQASAESSASSARGRLLPVVALSEEFQHYGKGYSAGLDFAGQSFSFPIHDQNTNSFAVAAQQPLTGLLPRGFQLSAASRAADAKAAAVKVAEASLAEGVRTTYLRLFQARATIEVARASEAQLREQLQVSKERLSAGTLVKADLLRLEVAAANAEQQEIQARAQEQITTANLLTALGRDANEVVDFVEPVELEQAALDLSRFEAQADPALTRRPEIAEADAQAEAAERGATAKLLDLLPEVNLEAAYVRVDGQALAQKEAAYVGLKASWPIWDWGSKFFAHRSAVHDASAARLSAAHERHQVTLEVSTKLSQARAAVNAVRVAEKAIVNAEEAFRVTEALLAAGSGTTTDLLDSQAALTQAKLNLVRARYDQAIARVALERATAT